MQVNHTVKNIFHSSLPSTGDCTNEILWVKLLKMFRDIWNTFQIFSQSQSPNIYHSCEGSMTKKLSIPLHLKFFSRRLSFHQKIFKELLSLKFPESTMCCLSTCLNVQTSSLPVPNNVYFPSKPYPIGFINTLLFLSFTFFPLAKPNTASFCDHQRCPSCT